MPQVPLICHHITMINDTAQLRPDHTAQRIRQSASCSKPPRHPSPSHSNLRIIPRCEVGHQNSRFHNANAKRKDLSATALNEPSTRPVDESILYTSDIGKKRFRDQGYSGFKVLTKDLPYWLWIASMPSPGYGVNLSPNPRKRSIQTLVRL